MSKRDRGMAAAVAEPPPVYANRVTLGSNAEAGQVVMIFGDPLAEPPNFVAFTPAQARALVAAMLIECDKAEGKRKK